MSPFDVSIVSYFGQDDAAGIPQVKQKEDEWWEDSTRGFN